MNYRRVMRIPSCGKVDGPAGRGRIGAGRMRRRARTHRPHRGGPLLDHRERHPGAQDLRGTRLRVRHHLPQHLDEPRGRHRLPQGHDGRAHGPLRGGHRQPAGHPGGLRGAERGRHRGRRARHRAGGAGPGGAAVLRHRRRRVPAVLRRRRGLRAGLRRPRGGARRRPRRTTCAGSPMPTAPSPSPTPVRPAGPSACPASCGCCRTSTPSTARPRGATCSPLP